MQTFSSERMTVEVEHDVVVFLIGARINKWWRFWDWIPVALAMNRMLQELQSNPGSGFLGSRGNGTMIQYWKSPEDLLRYASDRDGAHFPAWAEFYRKAAKSGAVGIWHETYAVPRENIEAIYFEMPREGLASFWPTVPARGNRKSARQRLKAHTAASDAKLAS